jgi:Fanconi anemia group M protein|tara:strand:+ start:1126 stop:1824 length:699 start_codon:yes stop_codon:yes gene_type:complete
MEVLRIDSRENSELTKHVIENCSQMNIPYEKQWLDVGDYVFANVCIEAKSSFDFLQSIINKRLWNQIDNMDATYLNNVVIVYGSFTDAFENYVSYVKMTKNQTNQARMLKNKFDGAFGKIILDTDCSIIWVNDARKAARLISVICKMQPIDREIHMPSLVRKRIATSDLRIDVLCTIKGISPKKAKLLIDKFGSIMELGEASVEEISELDGFGKVTAKRLIDVLNTEDKMVI